MRQNADWNESVKEDNDLAEANDVAEQCGYDKATYVGEWQGYKVYKPELNGGEIAYTGLPVLILVKDGEGRITRGKEIFACYNAVIDKEENLFGCI